MIAVCLVCACAFCVVSVCAGVWHSNADYYDDVTVNGNFTNTGNIVTGGDITATGSLTSAGFETTDTYWEDLRVSAESVKPGASAPDWAKVLDNGSGSTGVFAYLFDKSTEQEVNFAVQIPHAWKQGTSLHPHVHWPPVANGAAGKKVCWGLEYTVAEIGPTLPSTTIIYGDTSTPDETLVADRHYLTELTAIDMSSVDSVSCMLICRLFRDAGGTGGTDTLDGDCYLLEFDLHYEINTLGSRTEYVK